MKRKFEEENEISENEDNLLSSQMNKKTKLTKISNSEKDEKKITDDDEQQIEMEEFRMLSVRQPWANALKQNIKKIENRSLAIPAQILPSWLALHVSKTFRKKEKEQTGWENRPENEVLEQNCGKIIGLIRFKECLYKNSEEALKIDPVFTNRPKKTNYHWVVDKILILETPIFHESNAQFPRVSDLNARKCLTKLLQDSNEKQHKVALPKSKDKVFCEHCWKHFSKQKSLENHLKKNCDFTGNEKDKRNAISKFFLARF